VKDPVEQLDQVHDRRGTCTMPKPARQAAH
jgi:hypothetical protein